MIDNTLLTKLKTKAQLLAYLEQSKTDIPLHADVVNKYYYETLLLQLQAELVDFQKWVQREEKRIAIIFEGRDASGKGGTIRRFSEHLNPRAMRIVALNKPTELERNQWYFNRYIKKFPNASEIVFFDRSWYNRAVVEPVMGFCTAQEYERFMLQVPEFEHMQYESGTKIIKLWFSVSIEEQKKRFDNRLRNPLKKWKFSPVDQKSQDLWEEYTYYKNQMFARTHNAFCPWIIVESNNKRLARIESIKYVLSQFDYEGKGSNCPDLLPNPNIVHRFFRQQK